jgi:hypothetical protein
MQPAAPDDAELGAWLHLLHSPGVGREAARRLLADGWFSPTVANLCAAFEPLVPVPSGSELWYDASEVLFLQEDQKDAADITQTNAVAMRQLVEAGFELAYPGRRAGHEFIVTLRREARDYGTTAMDFAKRLLDYGFHAPTTYFPLLVPECLLIEPTETESKEELDAFVAAMVAIREEAQTDPAKLKGAPYTLPVRRLDDVRAAKQLDIAWKAA